MDGFFSIKSLLVNNTPCLPLTFELITSFYIGYPVPGKTTVYDATDIIDLENEPLNGGILVKTLVLSVDPYLRGMMRAPESKSYTVCYLLRNDSGSPLM